MILFQDEDLLVVDKPPGWLTHTDGTSTRPDLVTHFESRSGHPLGVHQRLDVSTSGVIAFSRSPQGARLIADGLKEKGAKCYLAVVEGGLPEREGRISAPVPAQPNKPAITLYKVLNTHHSTPASASSTGTFKGPRRGWSALEVRPLTGRTHQIRAHLATLGAPIKGDGRYGDPHDLRAPRALLHAHQLTLSGRSFIAPPPLDFQRYLTNAPSPISSTPSSIDRHTLYRADFNQCYRVINGEADSCLGWRVDRYGEWLWVIRDEGAPPSTRVNALMNDPSFLGVYLLDAQVDRSRGTQVTPRLWRGSPAPKPLPVYEAGVRYLLELGDQLSTGLFLDQRPQRAWLHQAEGQFKRVLNTFAHAGGFSIAAATAGAETVSIDLSQRWLDRIHPQLEANGVDPQEHRLLCGDVFDWLRRLTKRGERFDLIILDPPSTSVGTKKKRWSAKRDYPELIALTLPLLEPGGRILTATNHRQLTPYSFTQLVGGALPKGFVLERVCPPAVDFPSDAALPVKNLIWRDRRSPDLAQTRVDPRL